MDKKNNKKRAFPYFIPFMGVFILIFFFTAISTVLTIYIKYKTENKSLEQGFGGSIKSYIFDGQDGLVLIGIDQVHQGKKIDSYLVKGLNINTKSVNKLNLSDDFDNTYKAPYIIGKHNSSLWLYDQGLMSFNPYTFKKLLDKNEVISKNTFYKDLLNDKSTTYFFDNKTEHIILKRMNKSYLLNTDSLKISEYKISGEGIVDPKNTNKAILTGDKDLPLYLHKNNYVSLSGNKYKKLILKEKTKNGYQPIKIDSTLSFLNGVFLYDTTDNKIIENNDPSGIVIIHTDQNTNNGKNFTISSVSLDGKRQWIMFQYDIGINNELSEKVIIESAHISNNKLVIITKDPSYAFALDMKNGSMLWKY